MPNVFPSIQPHRERRKWKPFDTRVRAADGGLFINVPHPLVQCLLHDEWDWIVDTDLDQVLVHFNANRSNVFTYFEFTLRAMASVAIGTGNGAAGQVITLPAKTITGLQIFVNGGLVTNYTSSAGAGADGETTITTTGAGFASGGAVVMNATSAQRRHYFFYANPDGLDEEPVEANLYRLAIDFEEKMP